jgi:hypothetical protein
VARRLMLVAGGVAIALCVVVLPGLAAAAAPGASAASAGRSGITGRAVTIVCPGTPPSGQTCPRRAVRATVQVVRLPAKRRVATVHSTGTGSFSVDVAPGAYQLTATSAGFAASAVRATVHAHRFTRVTIIFVARHPPAAASRVG